VFWHAAAVAIIAIAAAAAASATLGIDTATITRDSAAAIQSDKNCQENNHISHISN
jgi:hypothetical protein